MQDDKNGKRNEWGGANDGAKEAELLDGKNPAEADPYFGMLWKAKGESELDRSPSWIGFLLASEWKLPPDNLSFFLLALVTSARHRIGPCPVHQHLRFVAAFTGRTGLQAAFFLLFAGRVRILVEESGGKEGCHSRALVVTGVANQPPLRLLPALAIRLLLDADGRVLGAAVGHRQPFLTPVHSAGDSC